MPTPLPRRQPPSDIPPEALPFLEEVGYLETDSLAVGDLAPDVPLYTAEGEVVNLRHFPERRPVVLIFGSHT